MDTVPSSSNFQIRSATLTDLATIVEFNLLLAEESEGKRLPPAIVQQGVSGILTQPARGLYFLAEQPLTADPPTLSQTIGQILITKEWSDWRNGDFWWIQSVYVIPTARRQGVFRSLYQHVRRTALQTSDVVGLRLYVKETNQSAIATYQHLGMLDTGYYVMEEEFSK